MNKNEYRIHLHNERYNNGLCVYCGNNAHEPNKKGCTECLSNKYKIQAKYLKNNKYQKAKIYSQKIRWDVIKKYGGVCTCCGEDKFPFLVIDHIKNDGSIERKTLYGSQNGASSSWYLKLRREPIRTDLQVLCWNCNAAKQTMGECPHKTGNVIPDFSQLEIDGRRQSHFGLKTKIQWPDDDVLLKMVNESNCSQVARELGVHNTAVRGRLKRRGIYEPKQKTDKRSI